MNNLIEEEETEISTIEKPKRVMSDKTRDALAEGKRKALEKKALDKTPNSIPEPILKKKTLNPTDAPIATPKATPKKKQKQIIVIQSESESDDDTPTIIIKRKSKKADVPPIPPVQLPPPQVFEPVEPEPTPKPIYKMRRI